MIIEVVTRLGKRYRLFNGRAANNLARLWAWPGMTVTFRAELMPGRDRDHRTVRVKELLPSGRVTLHEIAGEHAQKEFDPIP